MNCPNCGHPDTSHNDAGCFHDDGAPCFCRTSGEEIRYPDEYHQLPSMKAWTLGREISIKTTMITGKFEFETDRDEFGYVTAKSIDDALSLIVSHLQKPDHPMRCSLGYDMRESGF